MLGAGYGDAYPADPYQWCDTDGDSFGDEYDFDLDPLTNLRLNESGDAFPLDETQFRDQDGDGIGDNYSYSLGTDGLRTNQEGDAFPTNPLQHQDTDGDGWGDIYTWFEDMIGLRIEEGDAFFTDPLAWSDLDGDGCPTASDTGLRIDKHPEDSTRCDEDLDFDLPAQLNLHAVGNETTWAISVDWKSTIESTESVSIYGLSWNATEGMQHLLLNIEPPGAIPWWADNAPDSDTVHTMFEYPRGSTDDRLTLRLISTSEDGQTLEYWMNASYTIETEEPPVDPPEEEMKTCQGCCGDTYEIPISEVCDVMECSPCGQSGDSASSEGLSMVSWSVIIIGILTVLVLGVLFMRRSDGTEVSAVTNATQTSAHAPCTSCGGPAHETINNGNRWTWCPTCRQWLNYLGKE